MQQPPWNYPRRPPFPPAAIAIQHRKILLGKHSDKRATKQAPVPKVHLLGAALFLLSTIGRHFSEGPSPCRCKASIIQLEECISLSIPSLALPIAGKRNLDWASSSPNPQSACYQFVQPPLRRWGCFPGASGASRPWAGSSCCPSSDPSGVAGCRRTVSPGWTAVIRPEIRGSAGPRGPSARSGCTSGWPPPGPRSCSLRTCAAGAAPPCR